MKVIGAQFHRAAFRPEDAPRDPGPDVVLAGRSNVGKSSLINRLLGVRGLAQTSSAPGRTRSVNFYRVNGSFHLVDLPGYGYARVPEAVRRSWGPMVEGVLQRRLPRIVLALVLVDARRGPSEADRTLADWLGSKGIPLFWVGTKSDKVSGNERATLLRSLREMAAETAAMSEPVLSSARTGLGMRRIWRELDRVLAGG